MKNILKEIKKRRKELGITQKDLSNLADISRQQYQKLESKGNPRLDTLVHIAKCLKTELMLIPFEKLIEVKGLLNNEAHLHWESSDNNIDDPWKGLLGDDE